MSKIFELYGVPVDSTAPWSRIVAGQQCPFLQRKCLKNRKSEPEITIGTCSVVAGKRGAKIMICPFRLLERRQIFTDCLHLLTLHQPGNELHIVPELSVPGGSVDYCLASVRGGKVVDFTGIELQTLDTTGTVWPERQRFLHKHGIRVTKAARTSSKPFGLNWKMTAKTILVQLHHKIQTFQHVSKHLVLIAQDCLFAYMRNEFSFGHVEQARLGDPMHFHLYSLEENDQRETRMQLRERWSTDAGGIAKCLGLQGEANVELEDILLQIEAKISTQTLLSIEQPPPSASLIEDAADDES
ncbi:MAG TPA: NotI family restriction endonuclease [Pirellulales bacterium]|nr:NotI family restriction endonuclease [Pirellulales bacterium]